MTTNIHQLERRERRGKWFVATAILLPWITSTWLRAHHRERERCLRANSLLPEVDPSYEAVASRLFRSFDIDSSGTIE